MAAAPGLCHAAQEWSSLPSFSNSMSGKLRKVRQEKDLEPSGLGSRSEAFVDPMGEIGREFCCSVSVVIIK